MLLPIRIINVYMTYLAAYGMYMMVILRYCILSYQLHPSDTSAIELISTSLDRPFRLPPASRTWVTRLPSCA